MNIENNNTMEMFLKRALLKISKEASSKRLARLKESCTTILELIQKHGVTANENDLDQIAQIDKVINKLIITLKLACESKQPSTMSTALDCLQKLMAYGYIRISIKDIENPDKILMDKVIEIITNCFDSNDDNVQIQIIKAFLTAVSSPACQIHERALMNTIRAIFNIFLVSKNSINQMTAKATLQQMLSILFQRLEVALKEASLNINSNDNKHENDDNNDNNDDKNNTNNEKDSKLLHKNNNNNNKQDNNNTINKEHEIILHDNLDPIIKEKLRIAYVDCFLSFRALCKLSMKELQPSAPKDSTEMRRKLLALELIQNILENAGPMLCKHEQFIQSVIKKYLFISLLVNGVSPFIKIFRVSLNVFNGLIMKFKDYLKNEIGVFFAKILLRILGSSHSSIQHKHCVLLLLQKVCGQAQTLVDMFLNYDCNMESVDIFETMVNELSSIAKGLSDNNIDQSINNNRKIIRVLALDCLVTIMKSLVQWSTELSDDNNNKEILSNNIDDNDDDNIISNNNNNDDSINIQINENGGNQSPKFDTLIQQKQIKYQVEQGKKLFNQKPKKGIDYLIKVGYIQNTSQDIASFLLNNSEGLNLTKVGQYLGEISNPFNKSVLYDYVDLQRFENMEIYTALRRFLLGFRLPGEGQQIDVIMEKFAERYYYDNKKSKPLNDNTNNNTNNNNQQDNNNNTIKNNEEEQEIYKNEENNLNNDIDDDFLFANADAVYIFAYHMIMLATDLHHPSVKKKITKQEWIKNNRTLNNGTDFPKDFLLNIYETIQKYPLKTRDDPPSASLKNNISKELMTPKQRQILFLKETKSIVQRSQDLIQEQLEQKSIFFKSNNIEHVKPMFSMSWCPMLAAFSMNLEVANDLDKDIYLLCLEGFRCAIRVSCIFYMETERNAFITSLSQFTFLTNLREMKLKNIEAIKCLIQIAHEDGNYLQNSWTQVLNCISQLSKIQIIGSTMKNLSDNISTKPINTPPKSLAEATISTLFPPSSSNQSLSSYLKEQKKIIEGINASAVVDHIDLNEIDRIFSNTVNINDNAIVEFVTCLCNISLKEINSDIKHPRTFSLQKLIEVAYYNMERIRFVWKRIWGIIAHHFEIIGCNKNIKIAMYSVDSLRQLSMRFLEKDELANYNFQNEFLKPFEYIIKNNNNLIICELVVSCLSQMILARASNIKSGWKIIFQIFKYVAPLNEKSVIFLAYLMLDSITTDYFHLISSSFFVDCVECHIEFGKNKYFKEVSAKAIESIGFCAKQLVNGNIILKETFKNEKNIKNNYNINNTNNINLILDKDKYNLIYTINEEEHIKNWIPILYGLSKIIHHSHIDVRTSALDRLFSILLKYGNMFNENFWDYIYHNILKTLFSNIFKITEDNQGKLEDSSEWVTTTCLGTLSHMIELFSFYFEHIQFLTEEFLVLLTCFVLQENFHLSSIGSTCLLQFIISNGEKWSNKQWTMIYLTIRYIIYHKRSIELLSIGQPKKITNNIELTNDDTDDDDDNNNINIDNNDNINNDDNNNNNNTLESYFINKLKKNTPSKHKPLDINIVVGKSNVILLLLKSIDQLSNDFYKCYSNEHFSLILQALEYSYSFSKTLNNKPAVWKATGKSEIMSLLIKQESASCSTYLDILFKLYNDNDITKQDLIREDLLKRIIVLMNNYIDVNNNPKKYPLPYAESKIPLLLKAIKGYSNFSEQQFNHHLPEVYDYLCDLILMNEQQVRNSVQIVLTRIGKENKFTQ